MGKMAHVDSNRTDDAIAKIETIIAGIALGIEKQRPVSIPLKSKLRKPMLKRLLDGETPATDRFTNTSWPAKTIQEAKRFSRRPDQCPRGTCPDAFAQLSSFGSWN